MYKIVWSYCAGQSCLKLLQKCGWKRLNIAIWVIQGLCTQVCWNKDIQLNYLHDDQPFQNVEKWTFVPVSAAAAACSVEFVWSGTVSPLFSSGGTTSSAWNCTRSARFSPNTNPELLRGPLGEVWTPWNGKLLDTSIDKFNC